MVDKQSASKTHTCITTPRNKSSASKTLSVVIVTYTIFALNSSRNLLKNGSVEYSRIGADNICKRICI